MLDSPARVYGQSRGNREMASNGKGELRVYNSMTQQKELLVPLVEGKVGMYVCGITAYDFSHLGHARAAVAFDLLYRSVCHR